MVSKYTKGLEDIAGDGVSIREIRLRSEDAAAKKKRKKLQEQLKALGLGDPSRNKRRFIKED